MRNSSRGLTELTFEITRRCPLGCLICSSNGGHPFRHELSTPKIKKTIEEAIILGAEHISLSGGDPFAHQDLEEICRFIKERSLGLHIYTCGNTQVHGSVIAPLDCEALHRLKELGTDQLILAIHGCDAKMHDRITTMKGSFRNLVTSVRRARETGLVTELHFVPTQINFRQLSTTLDLMRRLEVSRMSVLRFVPQGRGELNRNLLEMSPNEIAELRDIIQRAQNQYSEAELRVGAPFNSFRLGRVVACTAALDKATIRADGTVFPCVSMKGLFEEKDHNNLWSRSLSVIWRDSEVFEFIRQRLESSPKEGTCSDCSSFMNCNGGCLAQRLIYGTDPYCQTLVHNDSLQSGIEQVQATITSE